MFETGLGHLVKSSFLWGPCVSFENWRLGKRMQVQLLRTASVEPMTPEDALESLGMAAFIL